MSSSSARAAQPALHLVKSAAPVADQQSEMAIAVAEYLVAARQADYTAKTIRQYRWHLDRLVAWLVQRRVSDPAQLTRALLREWGAGLYDVWQPATVKQAVTSTRSLLKWLYNEHRMSEDLRDALRTPKVASVEQRTLWPEEIKRLLAVCDPLEATSERDLVLRRRDTAIISLLVDTGLRAAELCRLKRNDLQFGVMLPGVAEPVNLFFVVTKGGKRRRKQFGPTTAARLRAWFEVRPRTKGPELVFVGIGGSKPGTPLTPSGLQRILSNLGKRAGVVGVSPHSFRRAFACLLLDQGTPDELAMQFGGWEDGRVMRVYRLAYQAGKLYNQYSPVEFLERLEDGD